jgi:DnaJ-class molecular chaperone
LETNAIKDALEILGLPPFITKDDIKNRYKELAKKYHPDIYKDSNKMSQINSAYKILMEYIEHFKYSFDDNEINKQLPGINHNKNFRF